MTTQKNLLMLDADNLGKPSPPELFAIQCWGAFIVGIGMLCTQVPSFDVTSQKRFGTAMLFQFVSLTVLFWSEWPQLNLVYKWGGVPIFGSMSLLYMIALGLLPNQPPSSSAKKTQ
uniref:Uncharacterized protein n=1 Tax=Helicotheca tamesis TaxID=374047 RepID=A0A7S2HC76_9STRA|mmetsp:Transcript_16906/g.23180  ORF Transcript_16906/g.23180 Transcript_16906/m.23180 type:complete len:116 (+) Transcript_16906:2-349(+)